MLTNDMREVFHVGLRVLGYSGNSTDPQEIEEAYEKLTELMPSVRTFNSDAPPACRTWKVKPTWA